jgi:hypothetical protein
MNEFLDQVLHQQIVKEAKTKFKVWPSAYASGWVVRTYKERGGKFKSHKNNKNKPSISASPLARWYREEWINVCQYLETKEYKACGRSTNSKNSKNPKNSKNSKYPYCRPRYRISSKTPETMGEILEKEGRKELERRCQRKRQHPELRIVGEKNTYLQK